MVKNSLVMAEVSGITGKYVVWQKKKKGHFGLSEDENVILCKSSLVTMCINLGEASMELSREPGMLG